MKTKRMAWTVTGICLTGILYVGWNFTARSAYESAAYSVVESDGDFELREYPTLTLASTSMDFEAQGEDGSFMRLFGFISGENEAEQKIAMTVPVFMERGFDPSQGRMAFVLPESVASKGAPTPSHGQVQINKRSGGRFAVVRFAGQLTVSAADEREAALRKWMSDRGLVGVGEAETAGYDPPWTPGPLRRNEVLIRLRDEGETSASS